jgi:hypothetical protein
VALLSALFTSSALTQTARAGQESYFTPNQFACTAAEKVLISKNMPRSLFAQRIEAAVVRTEELSGQMDSFTQRQIYRRLRAHSFPLAMAHEVEKSESENPDFWKALAEWRNEARQAKAKSKNPILDLTSVPDAYREVERLVKPRNAESSDDFEVRAVSHVLRVAEPLTIWLLRQPRNSVSATQLITEALDIYKGDIVVAVGAIGTLFDEERMQSNPRNKLAVLGSRMKEIFEGDKNPAGSNYHFWSYLSMGLKGDTVAPALFSFAYERVYQRDENEYQADQLGLKTGKLLHHLVSSEMRCRR